jgi:hypothetical protein
MQHFYDAQIRRYLTQIVRLLSNFSYKDGKGRLVPIPVTYGDLTRQAASVISQNSENKIPSAPRMAVYITGLEMDRTRTGDSSYVNKVNIRERAVSADGTEYLKTEGKNYTVERLMPTPYTLSINVDIWSTNTDQKLQIMEQILMLFNPSLEIQTTDNYVDWTSLSVVNLENITFSSRTIPAGTESEIDIATLGFTTPIWITPPAKVKKLGVITNIITAIFADNGLEINMDDSVLTESLVREAIIADSNGELTTTTRNGTREGMTFETGIVASSHNNYDIIVLPYDPLLDLSEGSRRVRLMGRGVSGAESWRSYLKSIPKVFEENITKLELQRRDIGIIKGVASFTAQNDKDLVVKFDMDTWPSGTIITGPSRNRSNIDYIIDPTNFDPRSLITLANPTPRILTLKDIGLNNVSYVRKSFVTNSQIFGFETDVDYQKRVVVKDFSECALGVTEGACVKTVEQLVDNVHSVRVRVNNTSVSASFENRAGKIFVTLVDSVDIDSIVEYEVELYSSYDGDTNLETWANSRFDSADAWKNSNGSAFYAEANDIIEWSGSEWRVVFASSNNYLPFEARVLNETIYATNLATKTQYKWQDGEWILSFEGEYPDGTWRLAY